MLPRIFQTSDEHPPHRRRLSALALAISYAVTACLWIILSDRLLLALVSDREQFAVLATYKGWAFVLFSALLLYFERAWSEREGDHIDKLLQQRVDERNRALELSQAQLQVIMDHAPVLFYMRDLEGRYLWVNRHWEEQTGNRADAAIGATPDSLFTPEVAAELMRNQRAVVARNAAAVEEVTLNLLGESRDYVRAIFPLTTSTGEPYAVAGILADITQQRRIEQSLHELQARYRTLFDVAALGIAILDADGCYVDVNPAFAKMMGYDVETLKTMDCWQLTAPEDSSDDAASFARMTHGKIDQYVLEKQHRRADGTTFWVRLTASVLQRAKSPHPESQRPDNQDLYLAVLEDITARREVEAERRRMQADLAEQVAARTAELRHLNAALADAQRIAHVGSWSLDLRTSQLSGSEETYRILGLSPDTQAAAGSAIRRIIHPDDLERLRQTVQQAMAQDHILHMEHRIVRADGAQRYVLLRGNIQMDQDATPTWLVGTIQDITERKESELALLEVNRRLSALIEASPLAILVVRTDGTITHWNAAAERIYGYKSEEVIGTDGHILGAPEQVDAQAQRRAMTSGETFTELETKRVRADGATIDVSMSTAPIYDETGRITSVVVIVADITDRKKAEAQLRRLNQELETRVAERTQHLEQEIAERTRAEAEVLALNETLAAQAASLEAVNKELETFTYSVSHDLKAPLRGLDGYSRLLQADYADKLDDDGRFFVQSIRQASIQMAQLIDDLLAYSRIERRRLQTVPLDLQNLVTTIVSRIQHEVPNRHVTFAQNLAVTQVQSDPDALTFALRNLIDNAIKFSAQSDEPCVEIGSRPTANGWQLYVKDNGIGFDMQYRDRIFDIFQRLHRAEEYPGTGIGLAIVRKAVQRLQGEVWAESKAGEGATFYMEFQHEPIEQTDPAG